MRPPELPLARRHGQEKGWPLGVVPQRVEVVGSGFDGLMQSSKWRARSALRETIAHQLNHSLARSLTRSLERRGKRGDRGLARPRRQGEERREKRAERRAKREERGGRREERREKTEERPKEAARGPQMRPPEVPTGRYGTEKGRPLGGQREDSREKREERREKIAASSIHCMSTVPRAHFEKVMKT